MVANSSSLTAPGAVPQHDPIAGFWTDSQMTAIHVMQHPRSIAVIGATPRQQYGGRLLNAVLRAGVRLPVYPVMVLPAGERVKAADALVVAQRGGI